MDNKIITLIIILIFSASCLSMVSANNNTTSNSTVKHIEDNLTNYIFPLHITDNGIEFSDGFTGFGIDSAKGTISLNDKFTPQPTQNDAIQNSIKLAIIECYKSGKENSIQNVISQIISKNANNDIANDALNSTKTIDDSTTVKINNNTEATFTFELLKSKDSGVSDCLAYKVSLSAIEKDDVPTANVNGTVENITYDNTTVENTVVNVTNNINTTKNSNILQNTSINDTNTTKNKTQKENTKLNDTDKSKNKPTVVNDTNNNTNTTKNKTQKQNTTNNNTDTTKNKTKKQNTTNNNTDTTKNKTKKQNTTVNETNNSKNKPNIVNETNNTTTNIKNENNTTLTNQKNNEIIDTTHDNPQNIPILNKIIQALGGRIGILAIGIIIIAIAGIILTKKR